MRYTRADSTTFLIAWDRPRELDALVNTFDERFCTDHIRATMSPFERGLSGSQHKRESQQLTSGEHIDCQRKGEERVEPGLDRAGGADRCRSLELEHIA